MRSADTWLVAVSLSVLLVCVSSCGEDEGPGPGVTAAEHNEAGWTSYNNGDYAGAHSHFSEALGLDPGLTEARLGLAWCKAHEGEYCTALDAFDDVMEAGESVADAFAGRAATALAAWQESPAVASAESTLARDPAYEFVRRDEYNWRDLRLVLAQAYFALARYSDAQVQVNILDPDNGLDPGNSETWVVDGEIHPTYEAALAMEIELLWSMEDGGPWIRRWRRCLFLTGCPFLSSPDAPAGAGAALVQ